jgi:hypothetical protein
MRIYTATGKLYNYNIYYIYMQDRSQYAKRTQGSGDLPQENQIILDRHAWFQRSSILSCIYCHSNVGEFFVPGCHGNLSGYAQIIVGGGRDLICIAVVTS